MILDHSGIPIDDEDESYTVKALQNELDAAVLGMDMCIKHRDATVARMYALRAASRSALAEATRYKALWESVPFDDLAVLLMGTRGIDGLYDFRKVVVDWLNTHAPKPQGEDAE